jgi:hypothetical protein
MEWAANERRPTWQNAPVRAASAVSPALLVSLAIACSRAVPAPPVTYELPPAPPSVSCPAPEPSASAARHALTPELVAGIAGAHAMIEQAATGA